MAKYLDYTGLTYFKNKLDQANSSTYVASSTKGVANGVASLDSNGKVPSSQLPSYVDDVQEYSSTSGFPSTGETDKIYIAIDTGYIYRWSGSQYVQINSTISSAETAVKDGNGNTITTTYATKTELSTAVPASVGSATNPVYTNSSGVVTACTYSLNKTVPSDAVFTDTTYSTMDSTELNTGTATTGKLVTAKLIADYVAAQMTAITTSEIDALFVTSS